MTFDAEGKLPRQLTDPIAKDTVTVPDGGYTILRLHATNPGTSSFSRDLTIPHLDLSHIALCIEGTSDIWLVPFNSHTHVVTEFTV